MREAQNLVHSLVHSPSREGFVTLCRDSLLRNFGLFGKVVDCKVLIPEQVSSAVRLFMLKEMLSNQKDYLCVDRECPQGEAMYPDLWIIPEELTKGHV
jgi:hypothetical protein